jgi:cytochrome c-type biogenesis protein CcmH/NrfF
MHGDVMALVSGGYGAREILAAFQSVYGERVLMSPVKSGFNWVGYTLPSLAIAAGALFLASLIRRWRSAAPVTLDAPAQVIVASEEELKRISAAVRNEE